MFFYVCFFFHFYFILDKKKSRKSNGNPDQTSHSVASDQGLHFCHKNDNRHSWVKLVGEIS